MELFDLIQTLTAAHGPSGNEGGVREVIARLAAPYAQEITTDTLGNLIVHKPGQGPKVMLCAHMDSIGFIVTHVEEEGFLRVGKLGGVAPVEALYTPVRFQNGVRGVFVKEEKAEDKGLKLDACYVDIGAKSREEALSMVQVGDTCAKSREEALSMVQVGDTAIYDSPTFCNGDKVVSPYLDNRIACAILLKVLEGLKETPNDLSLVFTAQEEVGLRGARTAAWTIAPDWALAVDVTDVDDTPGTERCGTVQLGKGAAVKVMDSSVICHPQVVQTLERLAKEQDIPVQRDIMRAGGTDAGAVQAARLGVLTGGVSVPCRYIHTPVEMASLEDAQRCVQLLSAFVTSALD